MLTLIISILRIEICWDTTALSITILSITILSITILSIMILNIMILSITVISITIPSIIINKMRHSASTCDLKNTMPKRTSKSDV